MGKNELRNFSIKYQLAKSTKGMVNPDDVPRLKADHMELSANTEQEATRRLFKSNETSIQSMTLLQV